MRLHANRRSFLQTSACVGAFTLLPSGLVRADEAQSPNEKLNIAFLGVGGRAGANMGGLTSQNFYALCDTNGQTLAAAKAKYPDAKAVQDWRQLLDDDKIDAYVVSTAEPHHALASLSAMRLNKSVYTEKPLAHTVREARAMQNEYIKRRGKIGTQMGTQIHATSNYRRTVELVQAGAIGKVKEAHVWCSRTINPIGPEFLEEQPVPEWFAWDVWLGPAKFRPFNINYVNNGCLNWHRRWDFGTGVLGDMGSHLIDLPWWALQLKRPTAVECDGPDPDPLQLPPWQVCKWIHPARPEVKNDFINGPLNVYWYHGPEGMKRRSDLLQPLVGNDTVINNWGIGVTFIGDKGVLTSDYGKHVLSPSEQYKEYKYPEQLPDSLGHYNEWVLACKGGPESLCNFDYSGSLIEHNLLGNCAHRAGNKHLDWDPVKFSFTNDSAADKFLTKEYRDGWDIV